MSFFFICFIGTDGSGKSTLATTIFSRLKEAKKIRVKKTYGRHQYIVTRLAVIIGGRFFLKNKGMFSDYDKYLRDKRESYKKSSLAIKIYIFLLTLEYLAQVYFKISLPLKFRYSVISDRYVYDTIINDIAVDRGLSIDDVREILHRLWLYIPKPDITFLIDLPENIAISRKNDIPSISYLEIRNQMYKQLAATEKNIIILDGTLTINELQNKVFEYMSEITSRGRMAEGDR